MVELCCNVMAAAKMPVIEEIEYNCWNTDKISEWDESQCQTNQYSAETDSTNKLTTGLLPPIEASFTFVLLE